MRILVVRLGAMGDVIHALPAVAALGSSFPEATIGWVIEERWIELLSTRHSVILPRSDSKPLVDNIHTVNTRAWRKALFSAATRKASLNAIRDIRDGNYDVAIDFQGSWKSGLIAKLSGTPVRLGFSRPREHGAALFYTKRIATQRPHVIEQNLELAAVIGVANPAGPIASLPSDAAADARANKILKECGLDHFAIINPGAGWGAKCWPAESYAAVARGLCKFGLRSVINFGPAEEQLAKEVESASAGAAIALPCSIAELIAITKHAHIFVGGDTGPMHLAAALGVPVVGIFGPTDPARNGPFATPAIVLRRPESVTNHSRRGAPDNAMLAITPEEVLAAAVELIQHRPQVSEEARHV
jgi:heptosyltransferase I